ncbi:MAG: peptidase M14 [Acidimicrobiia bacterium]|nr:peptidase M14 [Acidimicrobiia bacterium]
MKPFVVGVALLALTACATTPSRFPIRHPPIAPNAPTLARMWDAEKVSSPLSPLVDHAEVRQRVMAIRDAGGSLFLVKEEGRSVENREIWSVSFGRGPFVVLMWSQMHGDEPTATSALFDLYEYIRRHQHEPAVAHLLNQLTVHTVPMLNPDGAERFQRRNVQNIDINRDALDLATPEARLLKALRDSLNPQVGYNLHNQNWRTSVGPPMMGAAISLLSVAYDEARSMNDGRVLTKKLGAVIRDALEPYALGRIGRYDDSFEPRAFGDQLTLVGTPVLLIETGPWPDANPDPTLVKLNYVALVRSLHALADGSVHHADPARYDSLPENSGGGFHTVIRGATVTRTEGETPQVIDVGLVGVRRVRLENGKRTAVLNLTVAGAGDLTASATSFDINAAGQVLARRTQGAAVGAVVSVAAVDLVITTGATVPADLMLLTPQSDGRYRVERIVTSEVVLGVK